MRYHRLSLVLLVLLVATTVVVRADETDDFVRAQMKSGGGFLSTVLDLAKWDVALDTDKIISEANRREMWTPIHLNDGTSHPYGLGWELDPLDGQHQRVHHGGSLSGFRSAFSRFLDTPLTVIILMNLDDVDYDTLIRGVFKRAATSARPDVVPR